MEIKKLYRRLYLKFTGRTPVVAGKCAQCGGCCRNLNLFLDDRWMRDRKDFEAMQRKHPELRRFYPTGVNQRGYLQFACSWLGENNLCSDYANRLDFCREHPSAELYLDGSGTAKSCGCRIDLVKDFEAALEKACADKGGGEQ